MIDFHSHILPDIDDGADCVETSLEMLRESFRQGVRLICATPHFYADEDDPASFLERREEAWAELKAAMGTEEGFPEIRLGAEVLYFPGISVSEQIRSLTLEGTPFLLVEPPMMPWSEAMLDEIQECGQNLRCIPVVAHVDRYMRMLSDDTLLGRVNGRRLLAQVNAGFFLHRSTRERAMEYLIRGRFQFIGSDCHDMEERRPNMGGAADVIRLAGGEKLFRTFFDRMRRAISIR